MDPRVKPAGDTWIGSSFPAHSLAQSCRAKKNLSLCRLRQPCFVLRMRPSNPPSTRGDTTMKVMVLVKASKDSEAGVMPSTQLLADMGKFNEELVKAGVMLAGEGLHPTSKAARVRFSGKERMVIDGPFTETKELIAGFWLWQVSSLEEAIAWVKRCPNP